MARFGAAAVGWWDGLPALIAELAERWQLRVGSPVGRGNTSLALRCSRANGRAAILKLTPEPELAAAEAAALRAFGATGRVPELWESDPSVGALLLEALPEATPLSESPRTPAVEDAAALIAALHTAGVPPLLLGDPAGAPPHLPDDPAGAPPHLPGDPAGAPPLLARVDFIFPLWHTRLPDRVPAALLDRGHALARSLAADPGVRPVLLHGDLHPGNVLDGGPGRGLVAIDPRTCVGDPLFDAVDWVLWRAEPSDLDRRLAALAPGAEERLRAWCAAFAAMIAASRANRGAPEAEIDWLLGLAA
jgi:streptomycin 6-kinase